MSDATDDPLSDDSVHASERLLRSLSRHGVRYVFANFGTDHTPLIEAAARIRDENPDAIPEFIACPHEFLAMSAAHGYAAVTGEPQAVLVHVDVGTQNLGAAMHNAHRASVPVFVVAGLAPITGSDRPGSRDHPVHYAQDVFDQPGLVREYCRWTGEYKPPGDPEETVVRGLERAMADRPGPVYVTATREALEARIAPTDERESSVRHVEASAADAGTVTDVTEEVAAAESPLVITGNPLPGPTDEKVEALVEFAERAGAGVVEHSPAGLCFPRSHPLHAGYDPHEAFDRTDLVIVAGTDVPWVPASGSPTSDARVLQIDPDPTKSTYPRWSFRVYRTIVADPFETLAAVADELGAPESAPHDASVWTEDRDRRRNEHAETVADHRAAERLTPTVVSAALEEVVDDDTVLVEGAVTSRQTLLDHLLLDTPGSYVARGGAGLGWAPGAAVGIKLARPESRVIAAVGDGAYTFGNPTATAWLAAEAEAPTLTVVYNNSGWKAVEQATTAQHPNGAAAADGVPESRFSTPLDLSAPAQAIDAHTQRVDQTDELVDALRSAVAAVERGTPAVVDVHLD